MAAGRKRLPQSQQRPLALQAARVAGALADTNRHLIGRALA